MNPPRTFKGVYSAFWLYMMSVTLGLFALIYLASSLVNPPLFLFFLFILFALSILWLVHRNSVRSIAFLEDHVMVTFIFFRKEMVEYQNLLKFSIKYEWSHNRTISTLQYRSSKDKVKSVDFRTDNLDHQQFKAEIIQVMKRQLEA